MVHNPLMPIYIFSMVNIIFFSPYHRADAQNIKSRITSPIEGCMEFFVELLVSCITLGE